MLSDDAASFLTALGGESISYTPRGGTLRTISAIVDRHPRARTRESGELFQPRCEVTVINNATTGVDASQTTMVGGAFSVAVTLGRTAESLVIRQGDLVGQDAGLLTFAFGAP
jgi:hypothetical protein